MAVQLECVVREKQTLLCLVRLCSNLPVVLWASLLTTLFVSHIINIICASFPQPYHKSENSLPNYSFFLLSSMHNLYSVGPSYSASISGIFKALVYPNPKCILELLVLLLLLQ